MGIRYISVYTTVLPGSRSFTTSGPEGMKIEEKSYLIFGDLENNTDDGYLTELKMYYIKNNNR